MITDVVSAIEFTGSAAITVGIFSSFFRSPRGRGLALVTLSAWFLVVALFAATQLFGPEHLGTPGLGASVMLPIIVLASCAFAIRSLREIVLTAPLSRIIALNTVRVLGVSFLILLNQGRIASTFALAAGWGDIVVGLAALPIAALTKRGPGASTVAVLIWNSVGLLDLVTAVGLGVLSAPGTPLYLIHQAPGSVIMTTLPYLLIPGFLVPLLATSHLIVFFKLKQRAWGMKMESSSVSTESVVAGVAQRG